MGTENIISREKELLTTAFRELEKIPNLKILAGHTKQRLGVISFYIENAHYNLVVKLLSDNYGIQVRGGCACAGTYGHFLLNVSHEQSSEITSKIHSGDLSDKPGWIRLSLHPTMTDDTLKIILEAIKDIAKNHQEMAKDYVYDNHQNEFYHKNPVDLPKEFIKEIFND